ncbi:MAG TPA: FAD:protein FMN transferase, partial [Candidatus Saccharimonadales bacterium]|nr:FAD:protein FMN transferase [Candidatus Saccharimonadales bacterium]
MIKKTWIQMGMPVTVEIVDSTAKESAFTKIFDYFNYIDEKFSTYKSTSEISLVNSQKLTPDKYSRDLVEVLQMCEQTKQETNGFFDIDYKGKIDPSGLVKGLAIYRAAKILEDDGFKNYYLDVGGDIQVGGYNQEFSVWSVGIKNPFNQKEIVKTLYVTDKGVATSGTYIRGHHIYNPKTKRPVDDIVSLTVIGPNIYEADRYATAAFAMGYEGIKFIESLTDF